MILYFLRHELAGDRTDWTGDDNKRPLTEEGKQRMAQSAQTLVELKLGLEKILTSPLTRARQTAEIAAQGLGILDRLVEDERLAPGFDLQALSGILADHPQGKAIMMVGHEPDFSETVSALTGGSVIVFKKGALARVNIEDLSKPSGELVWLIPPKVLSR